MSPTAFAEKPDFYVIKFIGYGRPLVLERSAVEAARERIKQRYNVLKEQNLDDQRIHSAPSKMRLAAMLRLSLSPASSSHSSAAARAPRTRNPKPPLSVVRVNVTNQPWDFGRRGASARPFRAAPSAPCSPGNRVLVTAELVANANYVEFETAEGGQKVPATVEVVDYEANLALLKTDDTEFLKALKPLEVAPAAVGDVLSVWQLESNGTLLVTQGAHDHRRSHALSDR